MIKLEHYIKFSHEICFIEYIQVPLLLNEWPLGMVTNLCPFHSPSSLVCPPSQDRGWLS